MDNIFLQMAILFVIIAVGFLARKCKLQDHEFDRMLSRFIINISCPCLVISSVLGDKVPPKELVLPLIAVGIASYVAILLLSWLCGRFFTRKREEQGLYAFMLLFGNVGFIGYPVVAAIFDSQAIFFASVLNFANSLFIFSAGPLLISGQSTLQHHKISLRFLISPMMCASYISIALVMLQYTGCPRIIREPLQLLGSITVPGALLIIGSSIAQMPLRQILGNPGIYAMCASRLFILPLIVYFFSMLFTDSALVITINTVLFAMPVATIGVMLCLLAGRDEMLMAKAVFISTLLSMLTIPCVVIVVQQLNRIMGLS